MARVTSWSTIVCKLLLQSPCLSFLLFIAYPFPDYHLVVIISVSHSACFTHWSSYQYCDLLCVLNFYQVSIRVANSSSTTLLFAYKNLCSLYILFWVHKYIFLFDDPNDIRNAVYQTKCPWSDRDSITLWKTLSSRNLDYVLSSSSYLCRYLIDEMMTPGRVRTQQKQKIVSL